MLIKKGKLVFTILVFVVLSCMRCTTDTSGTLTLADRKPLIGPDYTDITIPSNIAPLNFSILEEGVSFKVTATSRLTGYKLSINSSDGKIRFSEKSWRRLLKDSQGDSIIFQVFSSQKLSDEVLKYPTFFMAVSGDKIDPYLVYRLIYPGYYSWSNIKIVQRSTESFSEESIIENQILDKNCANCHSFNNNNPDRFMIHIRGSHGGTYFVDDGKITRTDLKIDGMPGGATYPSWHPSGRFLAFSSNQVQQSFYSQPGKNIEVFDLVSSLILYDRKEDEIISITDSDTAKYLQTFPSWSPDGRFLYFCRAPQIINSSNPQIEQISNTHYDLVRRSFDPESRKFGEAEIVFKASEINKSVSFPRISPDGKFLIFTLADYGTFPIWHREADLYLIDMHDYSVRKMTVNSNETESYHSWSVNGKWLVFSSKRVDGRSARPYFVHIDSLGNQGKEFVLPQEDPSLYSHMLESFNIPELVNGRVKMKPADFEAATRQLALKAKSGNVLNPDKVRGQSIENKPEEINYQVHE